MGERAEIERVTITSGSILRSWESRWNCVR